MDVVVLIVSQIVLIPVTVFVWFRESDLDAVAVALLSLSSVVMLVCTIWTGYFDASGAEYHQMKDYVSLAHICTWIVVIYIFYATIVTRGTEKKKKDE